ncbi:YgjV family protein [Glaciecola petra]|uniref:YgjV family protein n=1 Tax=Glaciecola petra TaxID=3075602 RepID=A0ABU2ZQC8_9ALTE|nr:YgjV family protein [Aestuariibacter sp. P117]MDT0594621.1 YgjV family protein [Aestuariibacter sp. P117]
MENNFGSLVAQGFGLLAFVFGLVTFLQKNDDKLKLYMLCLFASQVIHFYLMGAATASAANLLNLIRTFISLKYNKVWLGVIFIVINIAWGAYLYQSPLSILPILGSCFGTFSIFFLQGIRMRLAFIFGAICWLTHNAMILSIGGILLETIVILGNLVTIMRLRK